MAIICVIDFTEKNDDFIKHNLGADMILGYYLKMVPYIANMLSPITVFIATVFVTAKLAAHTEVIAMLSSGISFKRIMLPYFLGSIFIGVLIFILIGWFLPVFNKDRVAFERQYIKNEYYFEGRNVHMKIAPETYVYLESYNNQLKVGYQFTLESIKEVDLRSKLKATKIFWNTEKNLWTVENYTIRTFDGENEKIMSGSVLDTIINLSPSDFESTYMLHETFTLPELDNYIKEMKERGAENTTVYEIEKYERYTYPFAILILTIMGVIVSARKSREGTGFQIAFGFLLSFVYIIFVIFSRSIANAGSLSPLMAAWMPNIVFSGIGVVLYKTVPR